MSLLWTVTATFLYGEMLFTLLLVLPFISSARWRSVFQSRITKFLTSWANFFFAVFLFLLLIMLFDAIREIRKYSKPLSADELRGSPLAENAQHLKLFRAQRNFFIAGFSIFLFIVLRRLVLMHNQAGILSAQNEASRRQAESASATAKKLLEGDPSNVVKEKDKKIQELLNELNKKELNERALKEQAEANNREYDKLRDHVAQLENKLSKVEGKDTDKKSS